MATEIAVVNTPATSKINWTAGIAFFAGIAAIFGFDITPEMQLMIFKGLTLVGFPLVAFLRTFFNGKKMYGG